MKNLRTHFEVITVVLLSQPDRTATFQTVAARVEIRNLFPEIKGGITLAELIKLRTAIASNKYKHWFESIKAVAIKLK